MTKEELEKKVSEIVENDKHKLQESIMAIVINKVAEAYELGYESGFGVARLIYNGEENEHVKSI